MYFTKRSMRDIAQIAVGGLIAGAGAIIGVMGACKYGRSECATDIMLDMIKEHDGELTFAGLDGKEVTFDFELQE